MARKLTYAVDFDGEYNNIYIPELYGQELKGTVGDYLIDEVPLDISHFSYMFSFDPWDSEEFTCMQVQKTGGSGETARGDEYYDELTQRETTSIIKYALKTTLGIAGVTLVQVDYDDLDWGEDE